MNQQRQETGQETGARDSKRIAVIGSGISGLGSAWLLAQQHEVTVFEAEPRLGGHSNTVLAGKRRIPVDTGFIVYNEKNYPLLTGLFNWLKVPTRASDMSFGVSIADGRLEYAGDNLNTLFAQRRNLVRIGHWKLLLEILRFNRDTRAHLSADDFGTQALGEYLDAGNYSPEFRYRYLLPMGGAIWSCPVETMLKFPAASFARFFDNHGLLSIDDRPQWRTVTGGSREYVRRLVRTFPGEILNDNPVRRLWRVGDQIVVIDSHGEARWFDHVVLACHADTALQMIADATMDERRVLGAFSYQPNEAFLHTDETLLPRRRLAWSSWNYFSDGQAQGSGNVSVSYWMNRLQSIEAADNYIVTLNPLRKPDPGKMLYRTMYRHPVFDAAAIEAQQELHKVQGPHLYFAGAWTGYGFHEDGFRSAVRVADCFGINPPWMAKQEAATEAASVPLSKAS